MSHSLKQKLADRLAGYTALNQRALILWRSFHEVEKMISSKKKENTNHKRK